MLISTRRTQAACLLLVAAVLAAATLCRAETGKEGDGPARKPLELGPDGLPKYHHAYDESELAGLYSTLTSMYYCGTPAEYMKANFKTTTVQVPGFRKPVPVSYIKQNFPAPLVIVLLGGDGEVKGPFGELYPYWFGHAGFNVVTFDSSFTRRYPDISGLGVVGNFEKDTEGAVAIVDAYIKQNDPKSFTRVGVLGLSFGGSQALIMAAMGKMGKLPFDLTGCLAFSPPVRLLSTAKITDDFFKNYRFKTTMMELAKKFGNHVPVQEGQPIPFNDSEMKGALGFVFRDQLKEVVDRNDRTYQLKMLPGAGPTEDRAGYAEATGLQRFIELYTAKYWVGRGAAASSTEIWNMPNLDHLLPMLPDYAEIVIAANDPFDFPQEIESIKSADAGKHIIVLPRGGHLGMITSEWALVKAHHLFDKSSAPLDNAPKPASIPVKKPE